MITAGRDLYLRDESLGHWFSRPRKTDGLANSSIKRGANKQSCKSLLTANAWDALVRFEFIHILQLDSLQSCALLESDFWRVFYCIDLFSFRLVNRLVAAAIEQKKPASERLFAC